MTLLASVLVCDFGTMVSTENMSFRYHLLDFHPWKIRITREQLSASFLDKDRPQGQYEISLSTNWRVGWAHPSEQISLLMHYSWFRP